MSTPFLGTGVAFPFAITKTGTVATVSGEESVEQAMVIILSTRPGERLMRPQFGCRIHELLFSPNTAPTHNLAVYHVTEALSRWEPRIKLVEVNAYEADVGVMNVEIDYQIRDTNAFRNMVFPFYLTEQG